MHIPALFEKSTFLQIVPFLTHCQLVYSNFDLSSFSLISYHTNYIILHNKQRHFMQQLASFHRMICVISFYRLLWIE